MPKQLTLKQLMDKHGLVGNDGADVIAKILRVKRQTVHSYMCRGVSERMLRLLRLELERLNK